MTIFESKTNRTNEQKVADGIQKRLNYQFQDDKVTISQTLPLPYYIDRVLFENDKIVGWVEIKCTTTYSYTNSEYYKIGLNKIKQGINWSESTFTPFYLAVWFTDAVCVAKIEKECMKNYPIKWGGRKIIREGSTSDQEPMISIPINNFKLLRNFDFDKIYN